MSSIIEISNEMNIDFEKRKRDDISRVFLRQSDFINSYPNCTKNNFELICSKEFYVAKGTKILEGSMEMLNESLGALEQNLAKEKTAHKAL